MSKIINLREIAEIKNGFAFKSKDFCEEGIPIVKIKNITPPKISIDDAQCVPKEIYEDTKQYELNYNDILISMTGSGVNQMSSAVGRVGRVRYKNKSLQNQRVGKVIVKDESRYNVDFLYYYLSMNKTLEYLVMNSSGSANQANISKDIIERLEVPDFDILDQNRIANILLSLDNKVENNNAIIANLEEQAKLIFEKEFMKNDLIKENKFEFQKFGELFKFVKGKKPKNISDLPQEDYIPYLVKKYIDSNEVTFASSNDGILIDDLDVFMLMDGANSGNIYYGYNGILGSTFSWLKNDNDMVNEYIYWYLLINQDFVRNQNTGSAIPHANKDYINNLEVMLPINIETDKTLKALKNMRLYSINLRRESNKLVETRDTLIPKLMSEELRIEEAIATK